MKTKELKEKSPADHERIESKIRHDISMAKLQLRSGQLANTAKIRTLRKDLARLLTIRKTS